MPERIQLSRQKGWRKPEGAIVVSRPSKWGNPYKVGDFDRDPLIHGLSVERLTPERAVAWYRGLIERDSELRYTAILELAGHDLACWCRLDQPCHADVLLEVTNQ